MPSTPTNFEALPGDGHVIIRFDEPADDAVQYRTTRNGVVVDPAFDFSLREAKLYTLDWDVTNGESYTYSLVAIAENDTESDPTDEVTAVPRAAQANPSGVYFSWEGIQSVLGTINAKTASNLDPSEDNSDTPEPDYVRIQQVGDEADAYTNRRARMGNNQYLTPIPDTSADFPLIQRATNLYAAFQLVRHRIWFGSDVEDNDSRIMLSLRKQAMELYDMLFGPARDGVDGGELNPDGKPQPGTFTNVKMRFEPACTSDEFSA